MEVQEERKPKSLPRKTIEYFQKNGFRKGLKKVHNKIFRTETVSYEKWQKGAFPGEHELNTQRTKSSSWLSQDTAGRAGNAADSVNHRPEICPFFSILVPMYETPQNYLDELIDSVQSQTYGSWQLCLADGSRESHMRPDWTEWDGEIHSPKTILYRHLDENLGIAGNTNAALEMASGDYVVFVDHDDLLTPDALYSFALAVRDSGNSGGTGNPSGARAAAGQKMTARDLPDMIYSDEDKTDSKSRRFYDPHFKPDYNEDLLRSMNYICHLLAVRRSLAQEAKGFSADYDGAQDYDFILRCVEKSDHIVHVPKILYHWRCHEGSTSMKPESKSYAFEAGGRALSAHYERLGITAAVTEGVRPGIYVTHYERPYDPLVSVIIPNKDHAQDLERTIHSVLSCTSYENLEWIIVENNSTDPETSACYERLVDEISNLRVISWQGEFNYSAINNYGASFANGEYLWLLNNDIEMITDDCVGELLSNCMRPEIGIVGARLYYGDDTVQHAGVIVGLGGVAGHAFVGIPRYDCGYMARDWCTQRLSAVTAACMMIRKQAFDDAGGFSEDLAVAFNDVDLCLKAGDAGWGVLYDAQLEAYHYESKTRGLEDTPEKIERFNSEMDLFKEKWKQKLMAGDPYYNVNLTLARNDFSLRNPYEIDYEERVK